MDDSANFLSCLGAKSPYLGDSIDGANGEGLNRERGPPKAETGAWVPFFSFDSLDCFAKKERDAASGGRGAAPKASQRKLLRGQQRRPP